MLDMMRNIFQPYKSLVVVCVIRFNRFYNFVSFFFAVLGGFERGLYVERWAPFVKVGFYQFQLML